MRIITLPPPVRSDNITSINAQIALGNVTKVPGTGHLYTSSLFPGLLLTGLRTWSDLTNCQGTFVLSGPQAAPRPSFYIDAQYPITTAIRVVSGTYHAVSCEPLITNLEATFPPKNFRTWLANTMWGGDGKEVVQMPVPFMLISSAYVDSAQAIQCVFGIITGASSGSHYGNGVNWDCGSIVRVPGGSGDTRHCLGHSATTVTGHMTTGVRMTLRELVTDRKALVLDGVPNDMAAQASAVYDERAATHWAMDKDIVLGTSLETVSSTGPISIGNVGIIRHSQVDVGIPFDGDWVDEPHLAMPPDRTTRTGRWDNNDRFVGPSSSVSGRAFVGHNFSYDGDGIGVIAPTIAFNTEVWMKAMFLGRANLLATSGIPASADSGSLIQIPAQDPVDISSLDAAVVKANIAAGDFGVMEADSRMQLMCGAADTIPEPNLVSTIVSAMRVLDKSLKNSF